MKNKSGFTLIELMMALTIVGLIMAVAIPAYQSSLLKSRRGEARGALMDLANRMEKYYMENNSYANATVAGVGASATTAPNGYYTLAITAQSASAFTLVATPVSTDSGCATFSLNSAGAKSFTGTGTHSDCW